MNIYGSPLGINDPPLPFHLALPTGHSFELYREISQFGLLVNVVDSCVKVEKSLYTLIKIVHRDVLNVF